MKSIEINITPLQKFLNALRLIKIFSIKNKIVNESVSEKILFPDQESISQFQRKAYMGNFMAGPFAILDPRFFKTGK